MDISVEFTTNLRQISVADQGRKAIQKYTAALSFRRQWIKGHRHTWTSAIWAVLGSEQQGCNSTGQTRCDSIVRSLLHCAQCSCVFALNTAHSLCSRHIDCLEKLERPKLRMAILQRGKSYVPRLQEMAHYPMGNRSNGRELPQSLRVLNT